MNSTLDKVRQAHSKFFEGKTPSERQSYTYLNALLIDEVNTQEKKIKEYEDRIKNLTEQLYKK